MFGKSKFSKIKNQGNIVFNSELLKELSPKERYELLQLCHRRKYKQGEFIYYQNDPGTGMYFIEEGSVQLIVSDQANSIDSESFTIEIEAPAEFGSMSINYEIQRMSSAKCLSDCTLLGFFKPDFETLKKRHPDTAVKFLEAVSMRAMKQLEITLKKLSEIAGVKTAYSIQFEKKDDTQDPIT